MRVMPSCNIFQNYSVMDEPANKKQQRTPGDEQRRKATSQQHGQRISASLSVRFYVALLDQYAQAGRSLKIWYASHCSIGTY